MAHGCGCMQEAAGLLQQCRGAADGDAAWLALVAAQAAALEATRCVAWLLHMNGSSRNTLNPFVFKITLRYMVVS